MKSSSTPRNPSPLPRWCLEWRQLLLRLPQSRPLGLHFTTAIPVRDSTPFRHRTGGRPRRGRGGGRRKGPERPQKTAADLDAEMEVSVGHILRELRTDLQPHFLGLHRQQWSRYGVNSTAPSTRLVVFSLKDHSARTARTAYISSNLPSRFISCAVRVLYTILARSSSVCVSL